MNFSNDTIQNPNQVPTQSEFKPENKFLSVELASEAEIEELKSKLIIEQRNSEYLKEKLSHMTEQWLNGPATQRDILQLTEYVSSLYSQISSQIQLLDVREEERVDTIDQIGIRLCALMNNFKELIENTQRKSPPMPNSINPISSRRSNYTPGPELSTISHTKRRERSIDSGFRPSPFRSNNDTNHFRSERNTRSEKWINDHSRYERSVQPRKHRFEPMAQRYRSGQNDQ